MVNHPNRSKVKDWPTYLRAFRATHNLTQAQLADHLQLSRRVVENWEGGLNTPPAYLKLTLQSVARALKTDSSADHRG